MTDETDELGKTAHRLSAGWHDDPEQGYCLLEYHWLRRHAALYHCTLAEAAHQLPKGDPVDVEEIVPRHVVVELNDVSPTLTMAAVRLNDALLADGPYQRLDLEPRLRALEPLLTSTDRQLNLDNERALLAIDWLMRDYLPAWLRLVPTLVTYAESLTALPAIIQQTIGSDQVDRLGRVTRDAAHAATHAATHAVTTGSATSVRDAAAGAAQAAGVYVAWDAAEIGDADSTAAVAADYAAEAAENATRIAIQHMEPEDATAFLHPIVSVLQDGALALFARMLVVHGE